MTRPLVPPTFATAAAYPAGTNAWSGQPPRVAPSGATLAQGFTPQADLPAESLNFLIGNTGDWIQYLDALTGLAMFGDSSDGAADLNGTNTYPWATLISAGAGVFYYQLLRDVALTNLTIRTNISLVTGGNPVGAVKTYRVFGTGLLTIENGGGIVCNGTPSGGPITGGAGVLAGTAGGSGAGANGGTGAGPAAAAPTASMGGAGGAGGRATASGPLGGAATTPVAPTADQGSTKLSFGAFMGYLLGLVGATATPVVITGGAGGSAGGGNGAGNNGGGGGGGGGVVLVSFRSVVLANSNALQAAGGIGGSAGTGGGGGGGGGGGYVRLICVDISVASGALSSAVNCPGGAGGPANGGSIAGSAGAAGNLELVVLSSAAPVGLAMPSTGHQTGVAVFATGGSGAGFDYVDVVLPTPFTGAATGANAYKLFLSPPYVYDGSGMPEVQVLTKTLTGFRLQPDVQFAGEIYWEVRS